MKNINVRPWIQAIFTVVSNGYLLGFVNGKIFQGESKLLCTPGLNCYSCPGALASCPIGSLQAILSGKGQYISFYVLGLLLLFGVVMGRLICGFLCPFGWVQDLLYKIKWRKWTIPKAIDKPLRYLKYAILVIFVLWLPLFAVNEFGLGSPAFCKWICPSGTLFGGIPLVLTNPSLQAIVGLLFGWKMLLLFAILLLSIFIYRPFCKYLCPLGAFYALFQRFSLYQLQIDQPKCTNCKRCETVCKMGVAVTTQINSAECIRCGDCKRACPHGAISSNLSTGFSKYTNIHVPSSPSSTGTEPK